ncbi:hypothetical protein M758_1G232100 [Ceratodon purpureus]|nr:hypothetical protein M758_1G232100 [Ceratodon purpureus]
MGNTMGRPPKPHLLWEPSKLSKLGAVVKFNKTQCEKLISKLSEAVNETSKITDEIKVNSLVEDFNRVFMKARALIVENTRTDWYTVAINMDSEETFKELLLEVEIWYISVCTYMKHPPSLTFDPATPKEISGDLKSLEDCITKGLSDDSNRDYECQEQARFLKYKLNFLSMVKDADSDSVHIFDFDHVHGVHNAKLRSIWDIISKHDWPLPSSIDTDLYPCYPISKGVFGEVYRVKWMGAICAVKSYVNEVDFGNEASILATLSHPNIIKFLDYERHENEGNFIVMEHGRDDLSTAINRAYEDNDPPFPLPVAFDIISQIARGMRYLHASEIVHFDLKPSNVLLTEKASHYFTVKIIDFVLSKRIVKGTGNFTEKNYGTVKFMAPEIMKPRGIKTLNMVVDPFKSDVYSFAMTCFVILSGRMPFGETYGLRRLHDLIVRDGTKSSLWKPLESRYLKRLSGLKDLIEQCRALNPADRPTFESICSTLADLKIGFLTGGDFRIFKSRVSKEPGEDVPSSSM